MKDPIPDRVFCGELRTDAKEFIRPYLKLGEMSFMSDGSLSVSYDASPMFYSPKILEYEDLRQFIRNITVLNKTLEQGEGKRLLRLLNNSKEPHDYTVILQIIFKLIRKGFLNKQKLIDAVSKTENIPALVELIKFEDYSVFDERLQL